MSTYETDYESILFRYNEGLPFSEIIKPLEETAFHSDNLVLGYAGGGVGSRADLIPYFHLLSQTGHGEARRIFIVAHAPDADNRLAFGLLAAVLRLQSNKTQLQDAEITVLPKVPNLLTSDHEKSDQVLRILRKEFRRLQPHVLIEVTDGAIANAAPLSKLVAENGNKIKGLRPECEVYAAPADQPGPAIAEKLNGLILSKFPN